MSRQVSGKLQWAFGFFESIFSKRGDMVAPPTEAKDYLLKVTSVDNDRQTMEIELHEVDPS